MGLTRYITDLGRPIAYYPNLKNITGSTTASILLCQFLYWTDKTKDDGWIWKTSEELEEETGLTYNEQRTARKNLVGLNLIEEEYKRLDHYIKFRVNQNAFNALWEEQGGDTALFIPGAGQEKSEQKKPEQKKPEQNEQIGELYPRDKDALDYALGENAEKANKIYEAKRNIIETIEKKLTLTGIAENVRWIKFVDFAYSRMQKFGEDINIFLNWTLHNEAYNPAYWTPEKMKTLWPQAFVANEPDEDFVRPLPEKEEVEAEPTAWPKDFGRKTKPF